MYMEILIPGLILVALMVYASTRIKKNAARAYEREEIETDEFSIVKPDGFIIPVNDTSELAFEAYSKEFGRDEADKIRQAAISISVFDGRNLAEVRGQTLRGIDESNVRTDANKDVVAVERTEDGIVIDDSYKLIEKNSRVYRLQISVLREHKNEYSRKTQEMLDSFAVR